MVNYATHYIVFNVHFDSVITSNYASMALFIVVVLLPFMSLIY